MASEKEEVSFPNESPAYRSSRDQLLQAEIELRRKLEDVAALRRTLPLGGKVKEDYVFEEGGRDLDDVETQRQPPRGPDLAAVEPVRLHAGGTGNRLAPAAGVRLGGVAAVRPSPVGLPPGEPEKL